MEHKEWYKKWFDTKYYHILYQNRDDKEAEFFLSNVLKKIHLKENSIIWDNACGRGRHSYFLSKFGYKVIGTDICENNINFAKTNYVKPNLQFFVHDMRREFYTNYFDLVLNLFTSIGYFEYEYEEKKAIKIMANSLKKEGHIIIDFFNTEFIKNMAFQPEIKQIDGILFEIAKEIKNDKIIKTIKIKEKDTELLFQEKVKILPKEFFISELHKNSIEVQAIWGDYDLSEYNLNTSKRMIFFGRKR